jgi:hypothetical protein
LPFALFTEIHFRLLCFSSPPLLALLIPRQRNQISGLGANSERHYSRQKVKFLCQKLANLAEFRGTFAVYNYLFITEKSHQINT